MTDINTLEDNLKEIAKNLNLRLNETNERIDKLINMVHELQKEVGKNFYVIEDD